MKDEIIIYQANEQSTRLEVRIEEDTVWLTQAQMADLFQTTRNNITLHISNIFKEKELDEISVGKESLLTAGDGKKYKTKFYNLDIIIYVGYRVKSIRGTQFRIWANKVLKDYLLRGYAVNQRFDRIEKDVHYLKERVDEFDCTHLYLLISPDFSFLIYETKSRFTSGARINKPRILGKAIERIIISEKSITEPRLDAEPITIKIRNMEK